MSEKRIEELLDKVAKEAAYQAGRTGVSRVFAISEVLRRELLPLLLAGQAMRDAWDAALGGSEESDGTTNR